MVALLLAIAVCSAAPAGAQRDAIRHVALKQLFNAAPGEPELSRAAYADFDGDGVEEAVIPLSAGGRGTGAIAVYGFDDAGLLRPLLLHEGHALTFEVHDRKLTITEPVAGAQKGHTVMIYGWKGGALVLLDKRAVKD